LGLDSNCIAVAGESAGGGHAALLAIAARDRGEVPIIFQSLVYPMLDDRTGSSRDVPFPVGALLWTPAYNRFGWRSFLGQNPGTTTVPSSAVPSRAANYTGLAPAWIGVGSIDLFVAENIEYARCLINAGVSTELLVVPGAFHGFDLFAANSSPATRFRQSRLSALKHAFVQFQPGTDNPNDK
jgi:acetyl esterase/lipase